MEKSRKRFNSDNEVKGNRRKSRKSKEKSNEEEIINDLCMQTEDDDNIFIQESDDSEFITLVPRSSRSYTEDDDKKIIKYFKFNPSLLNLRDEISIYHIMKVKCAFEKSVKSLQLRFLNDILPNLFKYNVLSHADLIDFYDAAKLELPDEFIKILSEEETSNGKNTSTSVQIDDIAVPSTSRQCHSQFKVAGTSNVRKYNRKKTNKEKERTGTPDTSRQPDSRTEVPSSNTSEETYLKSILGFIQFSNSNGTYVFIPDTEPNIPSVKKRLLDEFQIQPDLVKILRKSRFDKMKQLKEQFDEYKEIMVNAFMSRRTSLVERMFPDAKELLKSMQDCNRPQSPSSNLNELSVNNNPPTTNTDAGNNSDNSSWPEIEIGNMGQLIASLSDTFDHVTLSSNIENQGSHSPNKVLAEIKTEVEEQDDVETVILSPYFQDHTYCKVGENNINPPTEATEATGTTGTIEAIGATKATTPSNNTTKHNNVSPENNLDKEQHSPNTTLFENACIPQIVFSRRCKDKIANENINVDHLMIDVRSKNDDTPNDENCDENKTNDSESSLANNLDQR